MQRGPLDPCMVVGPPASRGGPSERSNAWQEGLERQGSVRQRVHASVKEPENLWFLDAM